MKQSAEIYEVDELRWMSLAYMDSGVTLAQSIINDDLESSPHRDLVPIFLVHQALELMFKSALKLKLGSFPKSHNLEKLHTDFCQHFPDHAFYIPDVVLAPRSKNYHLFPELESTPIVQHERLRYPTDRKGNPWPKPQIAPIQEWYEELCSLHQPILKIWNTINVEIDNA